MRRTRHPALFVKKCDADSVEPDELAGQAGEPFIDFIYVQTRTDDSADFCKNLTLSGLVPRLRVELRGCDSARDLSADLLRQLQIVLAVGRRQRRSEAERPDDFIPPDQRRPKK